ncbi:MAG: histidinol dehydrogenase [Treponema sp.]
MIQIVDYTELDETWFSGRDFTGTDETVREIVETVKKDGDSALRMYGKKFDSVAPDSFLIRADDLKAAAEKMQKENPELYDALCCSKELALKFARRQKDSFDDFEMELEEGLFTGQKTIPVERAGVYVPAGRFPLISTVVMTVSPAKAAGVKEIILCTPPRIHPDDAAKNSAEKADCSSAAAKKPYADEGIMAAAYICGVDKCFACGGAQAVAAMAYGTETIPAVDVIVGPGNKFVAAAKKAVYGKVGIDMIAGPTEVFIIADGSADAQWLAADMLAQAEHDTEAQSVLALTDKKLADRVADEIEKQLAALKTAQTARESIEKHGRIIVVPSLEIAAELANKKAPEHLELAMTGGQERTKIAALVHNYGSLFIGHYSAEVLGDYAAGLNHTLPTSGAARYTGGLSVRAFLKTVTTLRAEKGSSGVQKSASAAVRLGEAEGLFAHAQAARLRLEAEKK